MKTRQAGWRTVAAAAALVLVAETVEAGKPPKGSGGGSGCGTAAETTYAGKAFALEAEIEVLGGVVSLPVGPLSATGELPATGGLLTASLIAASVGAGTALAPAATVQASILDASTGGSGDLSSSTAQTVGLNATVLGALGQSLLALNAGVLQATSEVECSGGQPATTANHGANLANVTLLLLGHTIHVPANPPANLDLVAGLPSSLRPVILGEIILNEQKTVGGRRVVNALRIDVTILSVLGVPLASVHLVVSHAESGITCGTTTAPCPCQVRDWVTGGGWITLPNGAKGTFGMVGGMKANGLQGHLTYIDHGPGGPKVTGSSVTAYDGADSGTTLRAVTYACSVDGQQDRCVATVSDEGEPGKDIDGFMLQSGAYSASGPTITHGNIQLHKPKACAVSTPGGDEGGGGKGKGGGKPR